VGPAAGGAGVLLLAASVILWRGRRFSGRDVSGETL
jgi:hypothetical protein